MSPTNLGLRPCEVKQETMRRLSPPAGGCLSPNGYRCVFVANCSALEEQACGSLRVCVEYASPPISGRFASDPKGSLIAGSHECASYHPTTHHGQSSTRTSRATAVLISSSGRATHPIAVDTPRHRRASRAHGACCRLCSSRCCCNCASGDIPHHPLCRAQREATRLGRRPPSPH